MRLAAGDVLRHQPGMRRWPRSTAASAADRAACGSGRPTGACSGSLLCSSPAGKSMPLDPAASKRNHLRRVVQKGIAEMAASRLPPSSAALRVFVTVARLGSTARAARAVNLTQSAVSKQVQTLEQHLGDGPVRAQPARAEADRVRRDLPPLCRGGAGADGARRRAAGPARRAGAADPPAHGRHRRRALADGALPGLRRRPSRHRRAVHQLCQRERDRGARHRDRPRHAALAGRRRITCSAATSRWSPPPR